MPATKVNMQALPEWLQRFADAVQSLCDDDIKPTPAEINTRLGRSERHALNGHEALVRAKILKRNGYFKNNKTGRWEKRRGR